MSKWKHPYVIVCKPNGFQLAALSCRTVHEPRYYRPIDTYSTLEKALKAKRKAYERSQK
jgi:hypothetical protein